MVKVLLIFILQMGKPKLSGVIAKVIEPVSNRPMIQIHIGLHTDAHALNHCPNLPVQSALDYRTEQSFY